MKQAGEGSSRAPPPATGTQRVLRARRPRLVLEEDPEEGDEGDALDSSDLDDFRWLPWRREEESDDDNDGGDTTEGSPLVGPVPKRRRT